MGKKTAKAAKKAIACPGRHKDDKVMRFGKPRKVGF
jgi:hypothetical protein